MKKAYSFSLRLCLLSVGIGLVIACHFPVSAQQEKTFSPELKQFDAMVLESRKEMRLYCARVQELIKQTDDQKRSEGLVHIRRSMALWEKVGKHFRNQPPAEYLQDESFGSRLDAVHKGIQDMERHLADGNFTESFKACSMTCGLFVKMHEDNGLVYAADRIFHLRKLAKKMIDEEIKSGLDPAREMLGDLLKLRDHVVSAPCPAPEDETRCRNYQTALKTLSAQVDELAISVVNGRREAAEDVLKNLLSYINQAYSIAL